MTSTGKAARKQLKDAYLRAQQATAAAHLPLTEKQLRDLLDHVTAAVQADGCDHSLTAASAWASRAGVDVEQLQAGLAFFGGYCDCEVAMNVDADDVFTPVRTPSSGGGAGR